MSVGKAGASRRGDRYPASRNAAAALENRAEGQSVIKRLQIKLPPFLENHTSQNIPEGMNTPCEGDIRTQPYTDTKRGEYNKGEIQLLEVIRLDLFI